MAEYKAKPITINKPAEDVAAKFADLTLLQASLDNLPAEQRAKVGDVTFTTDSIVMQTPQVGEIRFKVKERTPQRVSFEGGGLPMPMIIAVDMKPAGIDATEATAVLDIDIPVFLRPMVGGTLQKAVDQFASLISQLNQ